MDCIFCNIPKNEILFENETGIIKVNNFPVNLGHVLIIPNRHFESFFEITEKELISMNQLILKAKQILDEKYKPDGYNIGINIGEDAGQTIFHLHIHLIPRYKGDVENPKVQRLNVNGQLEKIF